MRGFRARRAALVIFFLVGVAFCSKTTPSEEVFVGVVNFRDRRCGVTLANLFSKAKYPSRVSVGVIDYTHTEDDTSDCVRDFCKVMGRGCESLKPQIQMIVVSFLDARGPGFARYLQDSLLRDQEFCLQVDAHTDFVQDWDVDAISTWRKLDNEYGILSGQPVGLDELRAAGRGGGDRGGEVDHLCQATVTKMGMVRHLAAVKQPVSSIAESRDKILAAFWSAGFSFSKCHAMKKVPYDPSLLYLFDGEEFSMFARYWTRGYDVYTPSHPIVGHDYGTELFNKLPEGANNAMSAAGKKIDYLAWAKQGQSREYMRAMFDQAAGHVSTLLGASTSASGTTLVGRDELSIINKYGLGQKRTLDQLADFTGVDARGKRILYNVCGKKLQIVPFEPDADPWIEQGDVWGRAAEELEAGGEGVPLATAGASVSLYS